MRLFQDSGHVREEALELYVLKDLNDSEAANVNLHLRNCQRCRKESEDISRFIRAFRLLAKRAGEFNSTRIGGPIASDTAA